MRSSMVSSICAVKQLVASMSASAPAQRPAYRKNIVAFYAR